MERICSVNVFTGEEKMKNPLKKLSNKFNLAVAGTTVFATLATIVGQLHSVAAYSSSSIATSTAISNMNSINAMNAANMASHSGGGSTAGAEGWALSLDPLLGLAIAGGAAAATGIGLAVHHFRKQRRYKTTLSDIFNPNADTVFGVTIGATIGVMAGCVGLLVTTLAGATAVNEGALIATLGAPMAVGSLLVTKLFKS